MYCITKIKCTIIEKKFLFFLFYSIVPTQNDFPYPPGFLHLACNSLKIASFIYYCFPLRI